MAATAAATPAAPKTTATLDDVIKLMTTQGVAVTKVFDKITDLLTDILAAAQKAPSPRGPARTPGTAPGSPVAPPPKSPVNPPRRPPVTGTSAVGYRNRQRQKQRQKKTRTPLNAPKGMGAGKAFDAFATGAAKVGAVLYAANHAMQSFGNTLAGFVGKANPAAVQRLELVTADVAATIGRLMLPAMERVTALMRTFGDAIASLSPAAQKLISGFIGGAGLGAVLTAVGVAAKFLLASLGPIPIIVGVLASALVGVAGTMAGGKELAAAFGSVLTTLGSVIETIAKVIVPVAAGLLVPVLGVLSQILQKVAGVFAEVAGVVGGLLQGAVSVLVGLFKVLAAVVSAVLTPVLQLITPLVQLVASAFESIMDVIRGFLEFLGLSAAEYKVETNKSVGAAVRQASIGGLQEFANKAYTSAYQGATNIPLEQLEELKGMRSDMRDLPGRIAEKLGDKMRPDWTKSPSGGDSLGTRAARVGATAVAGAATGAAIGSLGGPIGTAGGAAVGFVVGTMRELFS